MNYQHLYHAGNFADIVKHSVMVALIQRLQQKDKPTSLLDMHAGAGIYDLTSEEAQKSQEYRYGALGLLNHSIVNPAILWLQNFIREMNQEEAIHFYPGSPFILQTLLRPNDRLILIEKHPTVFQALKLNLKTDTRVATHQRSAYEAIIALLPPMPRRGLVLLDPPYEDKQEFSQVLTAISSALVRWPTGMFVIWYPIKKYSHLQSFYYSLMQLPCKEIIKAEIRVFPDSAMGLLGCGLIIINAPFKFFDELEKIIMELSKILSQRKLESFECQRLKVV